MTKPEFTRSSSKGDEQSKSGKQIDFPDLPESLPVAIYDNHCHLEFEFDEKLGVMPWSENLDKAQSVGIKGVVQVGVTLESSKWCAWLAENDDRVLAAVALHPNEAPIYENESALLLAISEIELLASLPRVRAIGETGLDFFRTEGANSIALQQKSFEEHIRIAKENDIALMIHDRDAHDEVVETLLRVGAPKKVVFHCYSGGVELAEICNKNGWYMSFAGNITIKRNEHLRNSLKVARKDLILIETDAPFLAPEPYRGRPNAPYLVPITARAMAEYLELPLAEVCALLAANTEAVYGSWDRVG